MGSLNDKGTEGVWELEEEMCGGEICKELGKDEKILQHCIIFWKGNY